jgi:hypothetical protein
MNLLRLVRLLLPLTLLIFAATASSALASTTIGQLGTPFEGGSCGGNALIQTSVESGTPYVVPTGGGVITSWQSRTGANGGTVKVKVYRPTGVLSQYYVVGEEGPHAITANKSPVFSTGVRIPVQAGDMLGMLGIGFNCTSSKPAQNGFHVSNFPMGTDPLTGTTASVEGGNGQTALEIAANVEPDADKDEYGDETQDACPADATAHALPCPVPPPAPPAPPAPDTTPPAIALSSKSTQPALKQGAVLAIVSTNENATLKATGSVSIPGAGAYSLTPASAASAANAKTTLSLGFSKTTRKKVKKALKEGKVVRASVHVVATDAAGNPNNATQSIKIVNPPTKKH